MRDFNFGNMSDEEFKREFLKILNMYKSGMDEYMRQFYGENDFIRGFGRTNDDDIFKRFFGTMPDDMNIENGVGDDGSNWEKREWFSPDGTSGFKSYSRRNVFGTPLTETNGEEDLMEVLQKKLKKYVADENYEKAGEVHKLIEQIRGKQGTEEENNSEE